MWRVRGQVKHNSHFTASLCLPSTICPTLDTRHWTLGAAPGSATTLPSTFSRNQLILLPQQQPGEERYSSWQPGFYSGNQRIRKRKDNEQSIWYKMRSLWSREAGPWPPPTLRPRYLWSGSGKNGDKKLLLLLLLLLLLHTLHSLKSGSWLWWRSWWWRCAGCCPRSLAGSGLYRSIRRWVKSGAGHRLLVCPVQGVTYPVNVCHSSWEDCILTLEMREAAALLDCL